MMNGCPLEKNAVFFYGVESAGLQSRALEPRDLYPLLMSFERWKE